MPVSGKEIYRCYDDYGPIQVFDDNNKRYLSFGNGNEQSCVLISNPSHLQYDYTRAMIIPLLFNPEPRTALILGLGGGSLASCLHRYLPETTQTVVELRQQVIDVAQQYFQLPSSDRLTLINDDAANYLRSNEPDNFDLIFSDIYSAEGVDELQLQELYLDQCCNCLSSTGWLVLNFWKEHRGSHEVLTLLKERFKEVKMCTTESENWVVLASMNTEQLPPKALRGRAKELAKKMGFSLQRQLARLTQVHRAN